MTTVVILALEGVCSSSIHGIIETCCFHNNITGFKENLPPSPNIIIASKNGHNIIDSYGNEFVVEESINNIKNCDCIVIPGIKLSSVEDIFCKSINSELKKWLNYHHKNGALICAHYTSILILGESNLLNKKRCICPTSIEKKIKKRYPHANLIRGPALLVDQSILTTTTAISWLSIAFFILYNNSKFDINETEIADITPSRLNILSDVSPYINNQESFLANDDSQLLIHSEQIIRNTKNIKSQCLADKMNMSLRTLHRRLRELTNETPKEFIDRVKVGYACELLLDNDKKIKDISSAANFLNYAAFHKAFTKYTGTTPSDFRSKAFVNNQLIDNELYRCSLYSGADN